MKTWVWRKQTNYLMGQHFYLKSQFLQRNEEEEGSEEGQDGGRFNKTTPS